MILWTIVLLTGSLNPSAYSQPTSEADQKDRLDCWLSDETPDQYACQALGCLWNEISASNIPSCYFPKSGYGYQLSPESAIRRIRRRRNLGSGFTLDLERLPARSRFGSDVENLKFQVQYYGNSAEGQNTVRFKFYDPANKRYEVPMFKDLDQKPWPPGGGIQPSSFQLAYGSDDVYGFHFEVIRTLKGQERTIFNTSIGGLTFSDQFLQLATYLPANSSLYGLGENPHPSYLHDMNYKTWPLFSRDVSPTDGPLNVYGVHPFYLCVESDGRAHGLFFVNSNAMEYTMLPAPGVSVRTTGGILDFFLFIGENPTDVIKLYQNVIGRPFMPPYWALGFQLSRWGYSSLDDIKAVVERTKKANLPYDVQYSDIDYMDQKKDFTWDKQNFKGLDKFINDTKADGLRWILILDPAILATDPNYEPYNQAKRDDLFIHWPKDIPTARRTNPPSVDTTKGVIYGNVWPSGPVAFPDFFKKSTRDWWMKSIGELYKDLKFDGLWIDMNEPSNFDTNAQFKDWRLSCPSNKFDDPAYLPLAARVWGRGVRLSEKTICMASVQGDQGEYRHYDVHSLYGWSETEPTISAARSLTGVRSMVFSRSTYPSSGVHGGHWLGDNTSRWPDLHRSIIGMLEFNLFGIPYIGADICGFGGNATVEMCQRWMQLGAFYPLSRNHNTLGSKDQDPAAFAGEVLESSRRALRTRYSLLPYLYTLFHIAHTRGGKVINSLADLYPTDVVARGIDTQFLWGDGLLISPVLEQSQTAVHAFFPDDDWYDYYSGIKVVQSQGGGHPGKYLPQLINLNDTILHVRGGTVFPLQDPAENTKMSRQNPFRLRVYPSSKRQAEGELFWDDGESIDSFENNEYLHFTFQLNQTSFLVSSTNVNSKYSGNFLLQEVTIYDTTTNAKTAVVNGKNVPIIADKGKTAITIDINMKVSKQTKQITVQWT